MSYSSGENAKIKKTTSEKVWNTLGYLFYFGSIIFLVSMWSKLPEKVPVHSNVLGETDRWGSKWELIILPGIGILIILFMSLLEKHPEIYNYPKRFNEANAERFYLHSRKLVNQLKNLCLIIFALILFESVSIALGWGNGFGKWFLPIAVCAAGFLVVSSLIKQKKIH
ncbi:DUF1648 domain-containing protein [Bacillus sonorensis]|uniref:DUF1648 domain-containing protein n=2 Tax=Bacillus sonorensis TaxID=119858 RepID=M5NZP9_9BACI|nr:MULTISPECIES: DUF1648 domain-containing protein [Bacillus]TWK73979.1 hypothetical protein CHCC20335_2264 [Bacillus paralicheniformis]ASB91272.1 hypothetical protein S101395_04784 [Bacillus sonorensis]EME72684.1 hypothetical protein BSONL12_20485 [Bacillus sonorensis L12]MBG9917380.1 membrane protein [Bacillus sonorensis]MCF7620054.1 DUF1648 domain-containing protein [Bacillus sonorensis]